MSTDQPYAYVLRNRDSWDPPCFPTADAAMAYVVRNGYSPSSCRIWAPVLGRYADGREEDVDVSPYMEEVSVDRAAIERQVDEAVTKDCARYEKAYPTEESRAYERSHRCSGMGWLFEREREELIRGTIEKQRWRWKELS